jgi:hypothetical protein
MKLFIDILRLKVMMTGMNGSQMAETSVAGAETCLPGFARRRPDMEVAMKKILIGLMAVAIVAAVVVMAMKMGDSPSERSARGTVPIFSGMMPEVVSTAEMPRIVMPTVVVHAFRPVAMSASGYNVN